MIHSDINRSKERHSRESRDFKAAHDFTFGANIVKYTSDGIGHNLRRAYPHPGPPPEGEGNRYVPPPSRGREGGGWGICWVVNPHLRLLLTQKSPNRLLKE